MTIVRYQARGKSYCFSRIDLRGTVEAPALAQAPGSPEWLIGAYNHFGRAVAAVDLGALVGLTAPLREPPALILVEASGSLLGLVADLPPAEFRANRVPTSEKLLDVFDQRTGVLWLNLGKLTESIAAALTDHAAMR